DAPAVESAGQFKAAGRRGSRAINHEVIQQGRYYGDKDEHGPDIFPAPERIDKHPKLEADHDQREGRAEQVFNMQQIRNGSQHGPQPKSARARWQSNWAGLVSRLMKAAETGQGRVTPCAPKDGT